MTHDTQASAAGTSASGTSVSGTSVSGTSTSGALAVLVRQIRFEGKGINSYELTDPDGGELPPFTSGAHIDIHLGLPDGGEVVRQYSLCNDPAERRRYVIAVLNDEAGRGGSTGLHRTLRVQDIVTISRPRNNFALDESAAKVILLAGGIGVTPLKSMAHRLERAGIDYELHYCAKDRAFAAFEDELQRLADRGRLHYHFDGGDPSRGLDIARLLADPRPGTHVYYCGPAGFMKACANAAAGWDPAVVHSEHFKPPVDPAAVASASAVPSGGFTVELASSGRRIDVGPDESIADKLNAEGVPVETSCASGLCGTCKTRYRSGKVDHRDYILDDDERDEYLTLCVSRCDSELLVLDL